MNPSAPLAVRLLVTLIGVGGVAFAVWSFAHRPDDLRILSGGLLMGAFGALPWVTLDRPHRARGVLGVAFAGAFLLEALAVLRSAASYPRACDPDGYLCQLENVLHGIGGAPVAAAPGVLVGVIAFYASVRTLLADHRALAR